MRLRRCQCAHQCWPLCVGRCLMCRVCAALLFCGGEEPGALPSWDWTAMHPDGFSCLQQSKASKWAMAIERTFLSLPRWFTLSENADKGTHLGALPYVGQLLNPALAIVVAMVFSLTSCYCILVKYFNPFIPDESQTTIQARGVLVHVSIISITPHQVQWGFLQQQHQGASWDPPPSPGAPPWHSMMWIPPCKSKVQLHLWAAPLGSFFFFFHFSYALWTFWKPAGGWVTTPPLWVSGTDSTGCLRGSRGRKFWRGE